LIGGYAANLGSIQGIEKRNKKGSFQPSEAKSLVATTSVAGASRQFAAMQRFGRFSERSGH
jgi:hypothetical protein